MRGKRMKKRSLFTNERGFFFPYVIVICFIMLTTIVTMVKIYDVEVDVTNIMLEQTVFETMIQMGIAQFHEDKPYKSNERVQITYTLPQGTISIQYQQVETGFSRLTLDVVTKENNQLITSTIISVDE